MNSDNLYSRIISFDNLYEAYRRVRLSKRYFLAQQKYEFRLERNLVELMGELKEPEKYTPRPYHRFIVFEPKKRQISAPHFNDRIVHQAVVFVIELYIVRHFIDTTYACIKDRGTHKAVKDVRSLLDQLSNSEAFYFKSDIRQYFASVNHEILKSLIRKYITCEKTLILLDKIVDSYSEKDVDGIPIGNLTSQIFANLYLNELDHFVVGQGLNYFRYMDDFLIVEKNKEKLMAARREIAEFLRSNLKLELHPRKRLIQRVSLGIDFCGYNIFCGRTVLRKKTIRRFIRRYKIRSKKIAKLEQQLAGFLFPKLETEASKNIDDLKRSLSHSVLSHCGFLKFSEKNIGADGQAFVNKIRLPYSTNRS